jgi:hypothetical protein
MFCTNCGTENEDDSNFCVNCGRIFSEEKRGPFNVTRTKKSPCLINLLFLFFTFFVLTSCSGELNGEALNKGKEYFSSRVLECQGKHYVRGNSITELEGFKYWVKPLELSEADRRNGTEWKGSIGFEARLYRSLESNGQWGEFVTWPSEIWYSLEPNGIKGSSVSAMKINGKWYVDEYPKAKNLTGSGADLGSAFAVFFKEYEAKFRASQRLPEIDFSCSQLPN